MNSLPHSHAFARPYCNTTILHMNAPSFAGSKVPPHTLYTSVAAIKSAEIPDGTQMDWHLILELCVAPSFVYFATRSQHATEVWSKIQLVIMQYVYSAVF